MAFDTSRSIWDDDDLISPDQIFSDMVRRATGGTSVISLKSPALASSYVKSSLAQKAQAGVPGALFEVVVPSPKEVSERSAKRHDGKRLFDYLPTEAADAYPSGYGERSAQALEREDNIFQMKGTFQSASLALAKLRARVEARGGDTNAVNRIFGRMWGLTEDQVETLPNLHVVGSEQTRLAAMEDRAYHSLSCHPAYSGGYRVDMATITNDSLGDSVPLNWPRIRTGMKAVAQVQMQADLTLTDMRAKLPEDQELRYQFDLVTGSQPEYTRSHPWELLVDKVMELDHDDDVHQFCNLDTVGTQASQTLAGSQLLKILDDPDVRIKHHVNAIAELVKKDSARALERTTQMMLAYDQDRALLNITQEDEFDEFHDSILTQSFEVPRYKLTRDSLREGITSERIGRDSLPDIKSHGPSKQVLNYDEFRSAGLQVPVDVPGALNLAIYIAMNRSASAIPAYKLLKLVPDPNPNGPGSVSMRLRDPTLYRDGSIRALGDMLFGSDFLNILDILLKNTTFRDPDIQTSVKQELWRYLRARVGTYSPCPISGDWRDLIEYLRANEEGWTLYYWARISIGKLQHNMSASIFAPIAAGEEVDFLTLMRRSVKARASRWSSFYSARYEEVLQEMQVEVAKKKCHDSEQQQDPSHVRKYIPPHLRAQEHLTVVYDDEVIVNRAKGHSQELYQRIVEMQVKSKIFAKIEVLTFDRKISVGISDNSMRDILIEFYQARWYSLHKRIEHARSKGTIFMLGGWALEKHPWGDFVTDYPTTISEILEWFHTLDLRAWTLDPLYVWHKLQKSLGELWDDISNEIGEICTYINESATCAADEQTELDAKRRVENVLKALSDIPAITLPTIGFQPRHKLPVRPLVYQSSSGREEIEVTTDVDTFVGGPVASVEEEDGLDDDDEPIDLGKIMKLNAHSELQGYTTKFLSYNEIWNEMGLGDTSDERKRIAFGLPEGIDLNSEHVDIVYGPLVAYEERLKVKRVWGHRMGGISKRLGVACATVVVDDM